MSGKLFVIGVGPGDPELLTLMAARILKSVPVLFVPKGREEGTSLALTIIKGVIDINGKEITELHFPMIKTAPHSPRSREHSQTPAACPGPLPRGEREDPQADDLNSKWDEIVKKVLARLEQGNNSAFITIGDPSIYSTFFYLYDRLLEKLPSLDIEIVPGISSINAAAARAGLSLGLGDEKIAVLPANYLDSLEETLKKFDTVVLMKVSKVFGEVRDMLVRMGLAGRATYVIRAGMDDERVERDILKVREEDLNYFSLLIVRKR